MTSLIVAAALAFTPADAAIAYSNAAEIVRDCTPRDPGTVRGGIAAYRILDLASAAGANARLDRFTASTPHGNRRFANVVAEFVANPTCDWAVVVSHYDTKAGVDCPGANDGASTSGLLTGLANALADRIPRDAAGQSVATDFTETAKRVAAELSKYSGRKEVPAKPIIASKPMSYTQITGIFVPFTAESNVNTNNVAYDLPFVMAHENAHRYGVAPENEANFFAFYILEGSDDPQLSYSVLMAALRYCQNALYSADYDMFAEIYGTYHPLVAADMAAYSEHWQQYEGKVAEVSESVNNTYLVIQGAPDGVRSYGRVVDLMLAWYDAQK